MARAESLPGTPPHAGFWGTLTARRWWPALRRMLTVAFLAAVASLLYAHGRDVDWAAVGMALQAYSPQTLALAAAFGVASHGVYSTYDLIGRRQTRHTLAARRVMAVAWVSYAFNLNFGSMVGGVGFRYRLYSQLGLRPGTIAQIFGLSLFTNWMGYLLLAGTVFVLWPIDLPPEWRLGSEGLQMAGTALPAIALTYVLACVFMRRRSWTIRGGAISLPSGRVAMLQLALSCVNWMLMAACMYVLLGARIDYPSVLAVLLIAAVIGAAAHVPAGLGVLEAIFIALLGHRMAEHELLAALLAYRAMYYLAPLAIAIPVYAWMEARLRRPYPR